MLAFEPAPDAFNGPERAITGGLHALSGVPATSDCLGRRTIRVRLLSGSGTGGLNSGGAMSSKRSSSPLLDALTLSGAGVVAGGISGVTAIVAARMLGPVGFGIWQTARLILQFASYSTLGVEWGVHRELPYIKAKDPDDTTRRREILQVALGFTIISAGIVGLAIGIFGSLLFDSVPREVFYLLGVLIISHQVYMLADKVTTASGHYGLAGVVNIVTSLAALVFAIIGILTLGVAGLVLSQICWGLLGLIIIARTMGLAIAPVFSKDILRRLIEIGLPTIGNGLIHLGTRSLDRVAILIFLGTTYLGFYGLALAAASYLEMVFQAIGRVVLPRFTTRYAETNDFSRLRGPLMRVLMVHTFAFAALSGAVVLWLPAVVHFVLPEYRPGISAASILLFGMALLSIRTTLVYFFLAGDRLMRSTALQLPLLAAGVGVVWLAMSIRPSIDTAAASSALVYGAVSIGFFTYALHLTQASGAEMIAAIGTLLLPIAYSAVTAWALYEGLFGLGTETDGGPLVIKTLAASLLFVVAQAPLMALLNRRTGAVSETIRLAGSLVTRRQMTYASKGH